MKLTVCELNNDSQQLEKDWDGLVEHVRREASDLVLLPEMPFCRWFGARREVSPSEWQAAVAAHDRWIARLPELAPALVIGTRPVERNGKKLNEGFVWSVDEGYRPAHQKYYLPDEPGFWEATWYQRGEKDFSAVPTSQGCVGFAICSELWFLEHARAYGRAGAELIVTPRCTGLGVERWLMGGRAAAFVSGAFSASSNRVGSEGEIKLGGQGWIVDPDGTVLGTTSAAQPFLTLEIDLGKARDARQTYPRYIPE
jgi:N-carbamoylputrescine amidase